MEFWLIAGKLVQTGAFPSSSVDPSPINKPYATSIDDLDAWSHPASSYLALPWRLTATPVPLFPPHGAISKVELLARMYRSQAGTDEWYDDDYPWPCPYYAPFVKVGGSYTYLTPDSYGGVARGLKIVGNLNTNNPGTWAPTVPSGGAWDITSLSMAWSDALLLGLEWGVAMDESNGLSIQMMHSAVEPQHHISQLVLRVTASDPPAMTINMQGSSGE